MSSGTGTILLVEDEADVRSLTKRLLAREGYAVLEAVDGESALACARAYDGPIDALVTDVVMPRMGGGALAVALLRERPTMGVVFISGYDIETAGELPPNAAFLVKPVRPEVLFAAVAAAIGQRRSLQEA